MKLLVDTCVSPTVAADIAAAGHDVVWVGGFPSDPGDEEILTLALEQSRAIVTLDKDFGELAVAFGRPHAGIVRLVALPVRKQAPFVWGSSIATQTNCHAERSSLLNLAACGCVHH